MPKLIESPNEPIATPPGDKKGTAPGTYGGQPGLPPATESSIPQLIYHDINVGKPKVETPAK